MDCKHKMFHLATRHIEDWKDDNYTLNIEDTFECEMCGATETIDVTNDWICENPYQ